jgi:hypothetical protein
MMSPVTAITILFPIVARQNASTRIAGGRPVQSLAAAVGSPMAPALVWADPHSSALSVLLGRRSSRLRPSLHGVPRTMSALRCARPPDTDTHQFNTPMPAAANASGSVALLNRRVVRERGIERPSTSSVTSTCHRNATNLVIVRVEEPMVKMTSSA